MNKPTRVALYARVSTKDKGQDTENQLDQLRQYCEVTTGWTVSHEYVDRVSAKNRTDRQQFEQLFEDARQRKFDTLLFWSLDRFSREGALATLQYLQELTAAGVEWRSHTEKYLDTCGGFKDGVISILAVIAKQERQRLSERTIAGLQRARKAGRVGGRPKVVIDRDKVKQLHASGMSLVKIAAKVGASKSVVHRLVSAT